MLLKKGQLPILIYLVGMLGIYSVVFVRRANYEFLMYVGVILFFFILIIATNKKVHFPNAVLWGLAIWATLHMSGGCLQFNGEVLYSFMLIPLSERYPILRYDQFVHIIGFGVGTYVMFCLLRPLLRPGLNRWVALSIVVVMAGLGVGGLNEVVEFAAVATVPETNVGGYENTALDMVSNLVGAVCAMIIIRLGYARQLAQSDGSAP